MKRYRFKYQKGALFMQPSMPTLDQTRQDPNINIANPNPNISSIFETKPQIEFGQPNYNHIATSNFAKSIMAYLRGRNQEKDFQDYDRAQNNPLSMLPYTPNTSDQSQFGMSYMQMGGMIDMGMDEEFERDLFADPEVHNEVQNDSVDTNEEGHPVEEEWMDETRDPNRFNRKRTVNKFDDFKGFGSSIKSFKESISAVESGGDYFAKNPKSSAFGKYQFIKGTREGVRQRFFPEMGKQEFENAYKTQPQFQENVMDRWSNYLLSKYKDPKLAATAHFLGEGAVNQANNPSYRPTPNNVTVGEYLKKGNFQKGGLLSPVTVHGFKKKSTQDFYNKIQDKDHSVFYGLMKMGEKYGFSTIKEMGKSPDNSLASYERSKNLIRLYESDELSADEKADNVIAEIAHKVQYDERPIGTRVKDFDQDLLDKILGRNPYKNKNSVEYEAHTIIQPKLMEEYYNHAQQIFNDEMYEELVEAKRTGKFRRKRDRYEQIGKSNLKEGGYYFLDDKKINELKKQGYEIEID